MDDKISPNEDDATMKSHLQNILRENYPRVFEELGFIDCGDGWFKLICDLCDKIDGYAVASQVKEKWGGLRFYIHGAPDWVHDEIDKAEDASFFTCEICGEPGVLRTDRTWIRTLCDAHAD